MGGTSSLKPYLLLLLLSFLNVITIYSTKPSKEEAVFFDGKFRALYVIGDSLVDPGNNNHLLTWIKANFPPYGSDFEGGKATGRFSNGKTIADYIAIHYGLPLVPAYLGLSEEQKNNVSLTGINYASASCGIFYLTGKLFGHCLSLSVQVDLLEETIEKNLKTNFKTQSELNQHLSESLFMTAIGVNDYVFFYYKFISANYFANKLLHRFLKQIERLHELGARNFFINNIKPLGCYPNMIATTEPRGSCNERVNRAIGIFNNKLRESLSGLKKKFNNTSFLYSDYFNFMLKLREPSSINHARSKQLNTTSPCCPKDYDGSLTSSCKPSSKVCKEQNNYIFFDLRHPTQIANFMYSIACFKERNICHAVKK